MSGPRALTLGRIAGAPVRLSPAWVAVAGAVVLLFGPQVARALPGLGGAAWLVALGYAALLALSVLVHEAAHAVAGRAFGQRPQEIVLTLWGGHTQFAAPQATPVGTVVTALAGPAANVVLAGLAWALGAAADARGVPGLLVDATVWANLLLAGFNALPGAPLDGGRMVESAVWAATGSRDRGVAAAGWAGRLIAAALVIGWVAVPLVRGERPGLVVSLLLVWVAVTLWRGASESVERGHWGRRLAGVRLADLAIPALAVPVDADAAAVLAGVPAGLAVVAVDEAGRPVGVLDRAALDGAAASARVPVAAACRAVAPHAVLAADSLPPSGGALVASLATAAESAADPRPGVPGLDSTPVWVLTDGHGAVRSVLPRERILTALATASRPDPEEPRP